MSKPIIGIPVASSKVNVNFNSPQEGIFISQKYLDIVKDFGGAPVIIPYILDENFLNAFLKNIDGLMLISGQDIDSRMYGEDGEIKYSNNIAGVGKRFYRSTIMEPQLERDKFEIALYNIAKENHVPILGICRGLQIINVAEGGTLYQEIPESSIEHFLESSGWIHYHSISIAKESEFCQLTKVFSYFSSSVHHQGIKNIGRNLKIVAQADDGIIEIVESSEPNNFIYGIQGHPEQTRKNLSVYEILFREFLVFAKNYLDKRKQ